MYIYIYLVLEHPTMCLTSVNQEEPGAKVATILSFRRTESACTSSGLAGPSAPGLIFLKRSVSVLLFT